MTTARECGRKPRPVWRGVNRSTFCMCRDMKYQEDTRAAPQTNIARFAADTDGSRNRRSGISGTLARASTATNAPSSASPPSRGRRAATSSPPAASVCTIPYATAPSPPVTSTAPGTSRLPLSPARSSLSTNAAAARTSTPTGTLTSSTQRQDSVSVSTPPTKPPAAPPPAPTAVQVPMARARAGPSGTEVVSRVRVEGARTAAPTPWTARAASSCQGSRARPPARLAAVNRPSPKRKTRLRPKRSPARPPSSMNPAKVRL